MMVRFTNHSVGFDEYIWDFGDGMYSYATDEALHGYESAGTYIVTLTGVIGKQRYDYRQEIAISDPVPYIAGYTIYHIPYTGRYYKLIFKDDSLFPSAWDFQTMYTAAQELAQGGRGYLDKLYYYNWAYQTGFVVYESLLLKLFGPGQFSLQVMNAVWMGGIGVLVHRIALRILPARTAACAAVLYALYPAPYFLAAVLTNQHICVFFLYLAVWLLIGRQELSAAVK